MDGAAVAVSSYGHLDGAAVAVGSYGPLDGAAVAGATDQAVQVSDPEGVSLAMARTVVRRSVGRSVTLRRVHRA